MTTTVDLEVIDFHARLPLVEGATAALLAQMDAVGVRRAVVVAGGVVRPEALSRQLMTGEFVTGDVDNATLLAESRIGEGRLLPCWFGNPHGGLAAYREQGAAYVGLELSPAVHGLRLDDPRVTRFVEQATELGHWVYVVPINREGCDVTALADLAARHSATTFVMGHLGYGNIDFFGIGLVRDRHNVVVETSGGYASVLDFALRELGCERVLFGSEYPLQQPQLELAKIHVLGLTEDQLAAVLGGSARRLLRGE